MVFMASESQIHTDPEANDPVVLEVFASFVCKAYGNGNQAKGKRFNHVDHVTIVLKNKQILKIIEVDRYDLIALRDG